MINNTMDKDVEQLTDYRREISNLVRDNTSLLLVKRRLENELKVANARIKLLESRLEKN